MRARVPRRWKERRSSGNFISFILLHLKAVIYTRGEVRRNAPRKNEREGGERKCDGDIACVPVCARKRHDVAIIIDMLACKRCLLYVCQCAVVVAIFQGRASSLIVPKFGCLSIPEESIDVTLPTRALLLRVFSICVSYGDCSTEDEEEYML